MATATTLITANLTLINSPNGDMDIKEYQSTDQENFDSFQITFNPVNHGVFFPQPQVSERGFGLLGVIGGCLLLFIFLVYITCMRQRKLYKVGSGVIRTNTYLFVHFQEYHQNCQVYHRVQHLNHVQRCNV